jgi:hypothetical protein
VQAGSTRFTWDLAQSVPQLLSDGTEHIWGKGGLLAKVSPAGCVTYALTDAQGSVQGLSNAAGSSLATMRYGLFGEPPVSALSDPRAGSSLSIGWVGEQRAQGAAGCAGVVAGGLRAQTAVIIQHWVQ